jgi:hypothetical protein
VRKPFPEFRARSDFLGPFIQVRPLLGDAAGSEAVDQNPAAVGARKFIVNPLDLDVSHGRAPWKLVH